MQINPRGVEAIQRHIEQASDRLENLARRAAVVGTSDPILLAESLIALTGTVEELRVSEEELHAQHQSLAAARELVEVERRRYQELFDYAPEAYLVTNPDGVIQEANRAAAVLFGVQENALRGKPMVVFIPEEDRRGFRTQLPWLFETERLDGWEIRLVPRRKTPVPVEVTVAPVRDVTGRGTGLRWLIRDISRRKGNEAAQAASSPGPAAGTTSARSGCEAEARIAEWRPAFFDACRPDSTPVLGDGALAGVLRDHILRGLFLGLLREGDRLPGVREVARATGLNHKVVTRAYRTLVDDGVAEVRDRSGVYVAAQNRGAETHTSESEQWFAAILAEAWRHRVGSPTLSTLIPLQGPSGTLRPACVEEDEVTRAMLCTELKEKFGLDAHALVPSSDPVKLAAQLHDMDLVVTTPFHAGQLRRLNAALGKPLAVATAQPDGGALSNDSVACIARLLVGLSRKTEAAQ